MQTRLFLKILLPFLGILMAIYAFSLTLEGETRDLVLKEGGIIETASAIGYFMCAAYTLYKGKTQYLSEHLYFFLIFVLFGFRELDFDKKFTTLGLLKSKFYVSSQVPWGEKIIGFILIGVLVYIVWTLFKRHIRPISTDVKKFTDIYIGCGVAFGLVATSKTLDGLARKLRPLGIELDPTWNEYLTTLEEVLELGIPVVILITLFAFFKFYYRPIAPSS